MQSHSALDHRDPPAPIINLRPSRSKSQTINDHQRPHPLNRRFAHALVLFLLPLNQSHSCLCTAEKEEPWCLCIEPPPFANNTFKLMPPGLSPHTLLISHGN